MYARPALGQLPMAARGLGTVDLAPRALTRAQEKADNLRRIQQIFSSTGVLGGVWTCDPDYVSQDSTGTTAAVVGAPMGLVYDQSRGVGLGPELVTNGTFREETVAGWTGWTHPGTGSINHSKQSGALGILNFDGSTGSEADALQDVSVTTGKYYSITTESIASDANAANNPLVYFSDGANYSYAFGGFSTKNYNYTDKRVVLSSQTKIRIYAYKSSAKSSTAWFSLFSVRELLGAHARQPTTANKPTLKRWPNSDIYWAMTETDTTALTVTFPSSLGSACYRARAGVNGIREYWNQTIGTTLNLVDGPLFAEVVLNRAPTPYEQRLILAWLRYYVPMAQPSLAAVQAIYSQGAVGGVWLPVEGALFTDSVGSAQAAVGNTIGSVTDLATNIKPWGLTTNISGESQVFSLSRLSDGSLLAGTASSAKVYRSTDSGLSWTLSQRLGSETYVTAFADLGAGTALAATITTGQIYKSTDYGVTWSLVQQLGAETNVRSLAYLGNGIVLAGSGTSGKVYRSADYGVTWGLVQQLGTETAVIALCNLGNGVALAGSGPTGQIYKSTDSGASWSLVQRLGTEGYVYSICSLGGGVVLAGTATGGRIYRSTDSGASWSFVQRLSTETYVFSMVHVGGGEVIAGTGDGAQIHRSTDSGASWSLVQKLGSETQVKSLIAFNDTVVAGSNPSADVFVSLARGKSSASASNGTSATRPTLRQAPESRVLFSDVSPPSAALTATFPSTVGATSTVIEVTPTGVKKRVASVGTTFNLLTRYKYWGGTVLVNRATTADEDAAILAMVDQFVPGLGSERVVNGTFDSDIANWNAKGWNRGTWDAGTIKVSASAFTGSAQLLSNLTAGAAYVVSASLTAVTGSYSSGNIYIFTASNSPGSLPAANLFPAVGTSASVVCIASETARCIGLSTYAGADTANYDNVSVNQIL